MVYAYFLLDIKSCKKILEIMDTVHNNDFFNAQGKALIKKMEISGIINYSKEKVIEA